MPDGPAKVLLCGFEGNNQGPKKEQAGQTRLTESS
jgi:hypothetical protein